MVDLEGQTLEHYELRQITGRGGMADVYRGYDLVSQRMVAVKVFKRDDEELLRRFMREAQFMKSLRNPHLMPIYDTGETQVNGVTRYYIVMPFMEGGTLRTRIRRSPILPPQACRYLRELANALDYLHAQGIIHRDIKSSNVLLDADGRCYLSDLGIARTTTDVTQLSVTGNVLGTLDYMAPELFEPHHKANALSDLYSLGVLLFEMVTGQLPFAAENPLALISMHSNQPPPSPSKIVQYISPQVDRVILKALEKRPALRYSSAAELTEAFCRAVVQEPVRRQDGTTSSPFILPTTPVAPPKPAPLPRPSSQSPSTSRQTRQVKRRTSVPPFRTRARIVTVLAVLMLLAVVGPIVYVLVTHRLGKGGSVYATDPLNNASNPNTQAAMWDQNSHCIFKSDGYHVIEPVNLFDFHGCGEFGNTYQDATISVNMSIISGHSGGIFFHQTTTFIVGAYVGYLFEVDTTGNYRITKSRDFSNPPATVILKDWTSTQALHTGTEQNTVEVTMRGERLGFYANRVLLTSLSDSTYPSGKIALLATSDKTTADIMYSNLQAHS